MRLPYHGDFVYNRHVVLYCGYKNDIRGHIHSWNPYMFNPAELDNSATVTINPAIKNEYKIMIFRYVT
jgi:hypothetical protein